MIDYEAFNKITEYLNSNDLDELRKYLEIEKNKYYLQNARQKLKNYLRLSKMNYHPFCGYLDNNKIVLFNAISAYILNSDEILTKQRKQDIALLNPNYVQENITVVQDGFNKFEKESTSPVGIIKPHSLCQEQCMVSNDDDSVTYRFVKENFNYAQFFLGENIKYSLCNEHQVCLANSEKGKGLIMGLK